MKIKELRLKNDNELIRDLAAMQEKVRELNFKLHAQELKNTKEIAGVKKDVARVMTILKERTAKVK